ncbi:hypothetical protein BDZ45DRAFT_542611, partial [Acephala macrosclerotiorum]
IRILHLAPGQPSEPIHVKLSRFPLSAAPEYESLSYTWGTAIRDHFVTYSGSSVQVPGWRVTRNLYFALQQLRHPQKTRNLWVDALCIKQENPQELSEQVRIMKDIYAKASNVVIWLGEETPSDRMAFSVLNLFRCQFQARGFFHFSLQDYGNGCFPTKTAYHWVALLYFFQKSWWLRVWILQEMVMAKRATVVCGTLNEDWELVMKVAQ